MISPTGQDGGQDFELNLASIIDCLTVIIAFLLLSSSFVSYGALDTAVAAPQREGAASTAQQPQALSLTVKILENNRAELLLSGTAHERRTLSRSDLLTELKTVQGKYPGLSGMVLTAERRVNYSEVIHAMDDARKVFPAVALGIAGGSL